MHPSLLSRAAELQAHFVPGKVLDSTPHVGNNIGDSYLAPQAAAIIGSAPYRETTEAWEGLVNDDNVMLRRLARKGLQELELALYAYDQVTGTADMSEEMGVLQERLHGHYDEGLYKAALLRRIELIKSVETDDPEVEIQRSALVANLEKMAKKVEAPAVELIQPTTQTLDQVNAWLEEQFGDIIDEIDKISEEAVVADSIKKIFDRAIATTPNLRNNNWTARVIDRQKKAISVYASEAIIVIPRTRITTKGALKTLTIHEVFGHALKAANAMTSGDIVGSLGTPTYDRFEESFEIALEQCFNKQYQPDRGIDHYMAVGLAVTSKLPIDEIATLFYEYHVFMNEVKTRQGKKIISSPIELAELQIQRTFAGMTDVDRGVANRKDINYLHGLNNSWKLLNFLSENRMIEEGMVWLMSAKFNPFDQDDRDLIETHHPMPQKLKAFFASD